MSEALDLTIGKHRLETEKLQWHSSRLTAFLFYEPLIERLTGEYGKNWVRRETKKELEAIEKDLNELKVAKEREKLKEVV